MFEINNLLEYLQNEWECHWLFLSLSLTLVSLLLLLQVSVAEHQRLAKIQREREAALKRASEREQDPPGWISSVWNFFTDTPTIPPCVKKEQEANRITLKYLRIGLGINAAALLGIYKVKYTSFIEDVTSFQNLNELVKAVLVIAVIPVLLWGFGIGTISATRPPRVPPTVYNSTLTTGTVARSSLGTSGLVQKASVQPQKNPTEQQNTISISGKQPSRAHPPQSSKLELKEQREQAESAPKEDQESWWVAALFAVGTIAAAVALSNNQEQIDYSNPRNNHDDQKVPHSSRKLAEKEKNDLAERMRQRRDPGYERLNVYKNASNGKYYVGKKNE